jgi:ABC-2 type transport system ATP-binding protein
VVTTKSTKANTDRPSSRPIIKVTNLTKKFGDLTAVDGISFEVQAGEIFGILGPNGAGKTTTMEMIEGLREITSGSIVVDSVDVAHHPNKVKGKIGVQLQASAFFEKLTLVELLKLFASFYEREVDPYGLLRDVELEEKAKSYPEQLSGGQRQRFSIATALVNDPVVLFLDEPTTGLDPQARRNLWGLIQQIRDNGKTIVLTTHYMDEAELLSDRVAIMDHGKIISLDTPDKMVDTLIKSGFKKERVEKAANLEDVFIELTGHELREN